VLRRQQLNVIRETKIEDFELFSKGKVRDIYNLGDKLLFIATDRLSAFDVVMNEPIPYKGIVLNSLSLFWFNFTKDIVLNHVITGDCDNYPPELRKYRDILEGRSMIVKKVKMIPFEFVVRGYLYGSAWAEYKNTRMVSGIKLPDGLRFAQKLIEPIFTPATKADTGHDINVDEQYLKNKLGSELTLKLKELSFAIFEKASQYCEKVGILIADTKFEFGLDDGNIYLCDELLTPDSSRFWLKEKYAEGVVQDSLDKQVVRDYLNSINWDRVPPPPPLPASIVEETSKRYIRIFKIITGKDLL